MKGVGLIVVLSLAAAVCGYVEKRDVRSAIWWGVVAFVALAVLGGLISQGGSRDAMSW